MPMSVSVKHEGAVEIREDETVREFADPSVRRSRTVLRAPTAVI